MIRFPLAYAVGFAGGWKVGTASPPLPPPTFDPEAGLTLTRTLPRNTDLNSLHSKNPPVVFAVDFTGLNPVTGVSGIIWESGGSDRGGSLCIEGPNIVFRAGNGQSKWPTDCSYIVAPCPVGTGTLVWAIESSVVRLWWNGVELGPSTGTFSQEYASSEMESRVFGRGGRTITAGSPSIGYTNYDFASEVRYYQGQTVA